jgi:uncharacterized repeat protein (TIGR03847 family)
MAIEFGLARFVDAETFGDPGQRTFRLRMAADSGETARLWMEKQQLIALSMAMGQALSQLRHVEATGGVPQFPFPESPDHEFKVGRMAVGLDASDRTIVFFAHDIADDDEEGEPLLRVRFSPDQCAGLRRQLDDIVSRGRPVCPLCSMAMDPDGHSCVRANGHSNQPLPEPEEEQPDESP